MEKNGLIHLYCGDGKGKTTAALGLALRWAGYSLPVILAQFQKTAFSGELAALKHLPAVTVLRVQDGLTGFSWQLSKEEIVTRTNSHNQLLAKAFQACENGGRCLLILDELTSAINCGLIDTEAAMNLIRTKPEETELVITGREPSEELCRLADYITKMHAIKHPMNRGVPAREGVEY